MFLLGDGMETHFIENRENEKQKGRHYTTSPPFNFNLGGNSNRIFICGGPHVHVLSPL